MGRFGFFLLVVEVRIPGRVLHLDITSSFIVGFGCIMVLPKEESTHSENVVVARVIHVEVPV
jgi:hypothetical protein